MARCFDLETVNSINIQWDNHLVFVPKSAICAGMVQVGGTPGPYSYFIINGLDAEVYKSGPWYTTTDIVNDSAVTGRGEIHYDLAQSGVGNTGVTQNLFNKQNGDSIQCYNIGKPITVGLTSTYIGYGSGSSLVTGDAGATYAGNGAASFTRTSGTNGTLNLTLTNQNTGTSSYERVLMNGDVNGTFFGNLNTGYTTYGALTALSGAFYTANSKAEIFVDNATTPKLNIALGSANTGVYEFNATSLNPLVTVTNDLGTSSLAWRDLYFSHTISESAIGVASSLGSNVTSITNSGSDENFQMVMVTSGNVAGTMGFIAFGRTWIARPHCIISAADAVTGGAIYGVATSYAAFNATSASSATFTASIIGAGTYTFNCNCGQ